MPKNNSKARKAWRKARAHRKHLTEEEKLDYMLFGSGKWYNGEEAKPGTGQE